MENKNVKINMRYDILVEELKQAGYNAVYNLTTSGTPRLTINVKEKQTYVNIVYFYNSNVYKIYIGSGSQQKVVRKNTINDIINFLNNELSYGMVSQSKKENNDSYSRNSKRVGIA